MSSIKNVKTVKITCYNYTHLFLNYNGLQKNWREVRFMSSDPFDFKKSGPVRRRNPLRRGYALLESFEGGGGGIDAEVAEGAVLVLPALVPVDGSADAGVLRDDGKSLGEPIGFIAAFREFAHAKLGDHYRFLGIDGGELFHWPVDEVSKVRPRVVVAELLTVDADS